MCIRDRYSGIDAELWEAEYHNPVDFLRDVRQVKLEAAASDADYLARYDAIMHSFDSYMNAKNTWYAQSYAKHGQQLIAYFSAEFGLHESLPIYSGGLGVLAGDHVKEASDLGLPFVAVGFIYPQGYLDVYKRQQSHLVHSSICLLTG